MTHTVAGDGLTADVSSKLGVQVRVVRIPLPYHTMQCTSSYHAFQCTPWASPPPPPPPPSNADTYWHMLNLSGRRSHEKYAC